MSVNILVMDVNWLGDVLFSTPVFKVLKRNFKDAKISVLIHPRCSEILENNPYVDELIHYDEDGIHKSLIGKIKLILDLKRRRFDTVYILHRSFTRALIAYCSLIRKRVGYYYKKRSFLLTDSILQPPPHIHRADFYLGILERSGITVSEEDRKIEFFLTDNERLAVGEILKKENILNQEECVVLNPGANWTLKRWPKENFATLADILIDTYSKKVIFAGAASDLRLIEDIARLMKNRPIVFAGRLSLKELAALFEKAALVISADSGPLHIASAVNAKAIGLYGPTSLRITGPYNNNRITTIQRNVGCAIPCYMLRCPEMVCMSSITVEDVITEIKKIL
ncbi:MAG: lipopolysaccharide heptosyltransferase II [Candidatus Omnitrophota bacterium]